jgi:hypothetical protein
MQVCQRLFFIVVLIVYNTFYLVDLRLLVKQLLNKLVLLNAKLDLLGAELFLNIDKPLIDGLLDVLVVGLMQLLIIFFNLSQLLMKIICFLLHDFELIVHYFIVLFYCQIEASRVLIYLIYLTFKCLMRQFYFLSVLNVDDV